jgi:hypothetical protein
MTNEKKRQLADALAALAIEPTTNAWPARLYISAAHWLEAEVVLEDGHRAGPELTIASEHVRAKGTGEAPPEHFAGFIKFWLGELVDGVRR